MRFVPPVCEARFEIKMTAGKATGVSGLEIDEWHNYDLIDKSTGKVVAHFRTVDFENGYNKEYIQPEQCAVDELAKKIVISYVKVTKTETERWEEEFSWD